MQDLVVTKGMILVVDDAEDIQELVRLSLSREGCEVVTAGAGGAALEQAKDKKIIRAHGVIGMKLIGDGAFVNAEDREKAIRFVMQSNVTDAVVIGFKSPAEIDEAISRINAALAVTANA